MPTITLPDYIDPAVLVPGQAVRAMLDNTHTRLIVEKVEPMLVCRAPDGTGVIIYAHAAYPADDEAPA
jgi:hypothetical protein